MRWLPVLLLATVALAFPAWAQQPHGDASAEEENIAEIEALIATIQARVKALGQAGQQRDESLDFLGLQVEKAIGDMTVQQDEKAGLMRQNADLNWKVEDLAETRGVLKEELQEINIRHDSSVFELEAKLADLTLLLSVETEAKAELLSANDDLVVKLETAANDRSTLDRVSSEQKQQIGLLSRDIAELQGELASLSGSLASSEQRIAEKEQDLAALQERLDMALATRVEELSRFRSEFFSRLHNAIGDHADMRIEGDRFVFQSEVLFESGLAEMGAEGQTELAKLARSLHDISRDIPNDLDWVLRVDGHTDRQAISTPDYPSNWELSTARAITVVRFLIRQGVPPYRLAATGFGEFQPLDSGDDEIAHRRNRRIEFKLTRK
jgi:chemotaxis protein MotB